ncbi:helix-turn-helix transcriptional regulator [Hoeflea sp. YIM 152468]|uniref:helix-turn-helix domain-containing protein n=1 Tax=Hoeflea sp. YIM 152468 TaxID=3031759 RepID=UPI0023DB3EE2|nr:helix-turn-helix transcriptional regulator [Hoeflea sp. YIM 152468]MDF1608986.1 helix-turn-helix transcriptional regulator [Hoeflea sp. YIM 152468]
MALFNSLCHQLIDHWVKADALATPDELYDQIIGSLSVKMALSVVETNKNDPYDWYFLRIKNFGYKSKILETMLAELPNAVLRDLDRAFVDQAIIPGMQRALHSKRPTIDMVKIRFVGVRVGYERLILPQKTEGTPQWCVSLAEGRFAIPSHQEMASDLTDESIIQLLIEGQTAKEIADMLDLSPRTIEHRIDRMKTRFGARNLVHLVAKLVGTQVDRRETQ